MSQQPSTECPHDLKDVTGAMDPDGTITVWCRGCAGKWTEDEIPLELLARIDRVIAGAVGEQ